MSESIKETADRLFGIKQSPKGEQLSAREISLAEMERYRIESQEKLKEKRSKGTLRTGSNKKNVNDVSRNPCSKCGTLHWDLLPDGRKYCLKCGHVEEPEICEFKCGKCGVVFQTPGKDIQAAMKLQVPHQEHDPSAHCDGTYQFEKVVKPIISDNSKKITGDKNMEKILVDFICDKCGVVVQLQAPGLEEAMRKTVPHKKLNPKADCDGTLAHIKQAIQKSESIPEPIKPETQFNERQVASGILERFKHPKLGKIFCENCYDKNECPESYYHMDICLHISIDKKLKKLVDRWPQ